MPKTLEEMVEQVYEDISDPEEGIKVRLGKLEDGQGRIEKRLNTGDTSFQEFHDFKIRTEPVIKDLVKFRDRVRGAVWKIAIGVTIAGGAGGVSAWELLKGG